MRPQTSRPPLVDATTKRYLSGAAGLILLGAGWLLVSLLAFPGWLS
jgi:hypothetical protein